VDVEALDSNGNRCLTFGGYSDPHKITFPLNDNNGASVWRGGYNSGLEGSTNKKTLYIESGIARVAIRTTLKPGQIILKASIPGMPPAELIMDSAAVDNQNGLSWTPNSTPEYDLSELSYANPQNLREDPTTDLSVITARMIPVFFGNLKYAGSGYMKAAAPAGSGQPVYSDELTAFGDLPDMLLNAEYIRFPVDAAQEAITGLLQFKLKKDAYLYIAVDSSLTAPQWIEASGFAYTGTDITIESAAYALYARISKSGEQLSFDWNDKYPNAGDRMYVVFAHHMSAGNTCFEDDFEDGEVGSQPAGWVVHTGPGTSASIEIIKGHDGNQTKALRLRDTSANAAVLARQFAPIKKGMITIEWKLMDMRENDTNFIRMLAHSGLPKKNISDKSGFINEVYLNAGGRVQYRRSISPSSSTVDAATLKSKQWYTIRYNIDMDAKKYDIYIDGKRTSAGVPFAGNAALADCLIFQTGAKNSADIYIDDVKITVNGKR
jgi:hypothetical protein